MQVILRAVAAWTRSLLRWAMARARRDLDWDAQYQAALFPEYARSIHDRDGETETCSMCGDICAVKLVSDLLPKKE